MTSLHNLTRGRFLVIQVLVLALFLTLFSRLWYLQVVGGDSYRAQADSNAVRDVIVQPQRGLIVDSMGRSIATNRLSWVVSVDRSQLAQLPETEQATVLRQLARTLGVKYAKLLEGTKLCGEKGAPDPPACWNGSPYEPVPVAQDVSEDVALTLKERSEDFPAITADERNVRSYPQPGGVNAAHVLGYVTPVTEDEYSEARDADDTTINASSLVGRAGLERSYDSYLRGIPGTTGKSVDSSGRVTGDKRAKAPTPGNTLVTSIDAKVQATAEAQLKKAILTARTTRDEVTGRDFEATSGSVVVMDPNNGRLVASASYPSYDPDVWVGGISSAKLASLYSKKSGEPLLSRATQAQLAPGSTFKPFTAAGALMSGYDTSTRLNCSSDFRVGNRVIKNFESGSYGMIGFDKALQISCNTFFYRVAYAKYLAQGGDSGDVRAKDALVKNAKAFGFGSKTGIDLPGEAPGRIADRTWRKQYWDDNLDYYCKVAKGSSKRDFKQVFAREFCEDGWRYRAGDAVNFAIGQGDTIVTPLQLATAYAALSNGGTLWEPRVAKAIFSPEGKLVKQIPPSKSGTVPVTKKKLKYIDNALKGTARDGTIAWKFGGFPLDKVQVRAKTGTAEVQGKQTTGWVATYDKNYVVVMMIEQGGTGSGSSGDAVRKIWEKLYGIKGGTVDKSKALIANAKTPSRLPQFLPDGRIEAPQ